jgi:hypothetical protein
MARDWRLSGRSLMRNISFSLTTPQFLAGTKDVTRRMGWLFLHDDEVLMAVEKAQGLGKGGKIKKLGIIKVKVRREPLNRMLDDPIYGFDECRREGFPDHSPTAFVEFFCANHHLCVPHSIITRIEFVKL